MENTGKSLVWGIIGGGIGLGVAAVCGAVLAACFMGTNDPNSFVTVITALSLGIGMSVGGYISAKKANALIASVFSAVTALLVMAACSLLAPQSEGVASRLLPPIITAIAPILAGYAATRQQDEKKRMLKKARKGIK